MNYAVTEVTIRTPEQIKVLLQGFRRQAGLTQAAMALRLGISQQSLSALERNADKVSADRLLEYLSVLGIEWVLRPAKEGKSDHSIATEQW